MDDTLCTPAESRFQVQIGEVVLGQREELLEVAALPGEQVTVAVTNQMQTLVLEVGAQALVSFNHFVREAPGLPPGGDVRVTLTRQLVDQSGALLPDMVEELLPMEGRVSVTLDPESSQYFVNIEDARVNDSAVYSLEVCSESGALVGVCVSAAVTVFVLDCELSEGGHVCIGCNFLFFKQWCQPLR